MNIRNLRVDSSYRTHRRLSDTDLTGAGRQLDELGVGFLVLDAKSISVIDANETFVDLLGLRDSDVLGKPFRELLRIEDDANFRKELLALHDNPGSTLRFEFEYETFSNSTIWVEFTFASGILESKNATIVSALAFDVTERQLTEQEFVRTVERLEISQDYAKVGSFELEVGAVRGWWSKTLYDLHEIDPANGPPTFEEFLERVHPEDRAKLLEALGSLTSTRVSLFHEFRSNPKYGDLRYFSIVASIFEKDGKQILYGASQDITTRHLMQEALRKSESQCRQVLETAAEGICVVNAEGVILSINDAGAEMLGFNAVELVGTSFGDLKLDNTKEIKRSRMEANRSGISQVYEANLRHRTGNDVWLLISTQPLLDEQGALVEVRRTMINITAPKKLEEISKKAAVANAKLEMLSNREKAVLKLVVDGKMNKVIARHLDISETTVERHRSSLMKKLRVQSIAELVRLALIAGTVAGEGDSES